MLADVMQSLIDNHMDYDPAAVVADVNNAIGNIHSTGRMHRAVMADPATYIKPNKGVTELLTTLRHGGKRLFLASNSSFDFVDVGMRFLVGEDWRSRFDVVIVSADKPNFFSGKHKRPFRQVDPETGRPMVHKVHSLKSDAIYAAGGVESLARMTGWGAGDVLYCGDSLWADLVEAHRRNGWHTAAIINELDDELKIIESKEYNELLLKAATLEELLRVIQEEVFRLPYFHDGAVEKLPRRTATDDRLIDAVESILKNVKENMYEHKFSKQKPLCARALSLPPSLSPSPSCC